MIILYHKKDCTAAIVHNRDNGRRKLIVYGRSSSTVNCIWMDPWGSWTTCTSGYSSSQYQYIVSLTKFEHYLMGGYTSTHSSPSTR